MSQYEKKPSGRVNYVWVLAGFYLLYTAYRLVRDLIGGRAEKVTLSLAAVVVFAVVGGWLMWREWSAYKYGRDHIDDPSTWSLDDDEEDADLLQPEIAELPESDAADEDEPEEENV